MYINVCVCFRERRKSKGKNEKIPHAGRASACVVVISCVCSLGHDDFEVPLHAAAAAPAATSSDVIYCPAK
jgi:hypothetical protein